MPSRKYPDDWDERRRYVYQRDNYTCQICGRGGGTNGNAELHAHHCMPISQGGSHHLSNLKTLCKDCHNAQHAHDITQNNTDTTASPVDGWVRLAVGVSKVIKAVFRHLVIPAVVVFGYFYVVDVVSSMASGVHNLLSIPAMIIVGTIAAIGSLFIPFVVLKGYAVITLIMTWYFETEASFSEFINQFMELIAGAPLWEVIIAVPVVLYALVAPVLPVSAILLGVLLRGDGAESE